MIPPRPGAFGEKNRLCTMSPRPSCVVGPIVSVWWMIGTVVREMTFQLSEIEIGMTGCTFVGAAIIRRSPRVAVAQSAVVSGNTTPFSRGAWHGACVPVGARRRTSRAQRTVNHGA